MKNRVRRTMIFLNCQRAALIKDAYVYKPDCVILDLEDAVAHSEKDSARVSLYNTLKYHDYHGVERWVRINGLDTNLFKEDIRAAVAGGCDGIRVPKAEKKEDVKIVEDLVSAAEEEFGIEPGSTMLMAALESPLAIINAYEIATSSPRMMGMALAAGDFCSSMHAVRTPTGEEMFVARSQMLLACRAAGIMCFDTVFTDLDDTESLIKETELIMKMGFDGKSVISPKQIKLIHDVFTPSEKELTHAIHVVEAVKQSDEGGVGVLVVDGKMVDIAWVDGAKRVLELAKAAGTYKGDLV